MTNSYQNRLRTALSLAQPTGKWTNSFGYDAAKRLTNVTSQAGSFAYLLPSTRPSKLVTRLSLPNTSYITNTYDTAARLTGTWLKKSDTRTLNKHEYLYNVGNQRTKHTRTDDSHLTLSYDSIGQLTMVRATNSGGTILSLETKGYFYDEAWSLNRRTNNSGGGTHTFKVDTRNQLTNVTGLSAPGRQECGGVIGPASMFSRARSVCNVRLLDNNSSRLSPFTSDEEYATQSAAW